MDLVELAEELKMKDRFKYLLILVDHFSKDVWIIPIRNKDTISIIVELAQVFINEYT